MQLLEEQNVRIVWDTDLEKYFFSIVDVIQALTGSVDASAYWRKLKQRLRDEGNETVTNCHGLKMLAADGKRRMTDVADTEQLFRLIQSIPSPKAEPFKQWMAQVVAQRIDQLQDPELSINQAIADYRRLGYSEAWINQRIKSIEVRKALTDEWQRAGVEEGQQYASLTDIIYQQWSGFTSKEYKQYKGLKKENLQGFSESAGIARRGGKVAQGARQLLEEELGHSVVSRKNAKSLAAKNATIQLPPQKEE